MLKTAVFGLIAHSSLGIIAYLLKSIINDLFGENT